MIELSNTPGHKPGAVGLPGRLTEASMYPVVKHSLFHDVNMPEITRFKRSKQ